MSMLVESVCLAQLGSRRCEQQTNRNAVRSESEPQMIRTLNLQGYRGFKSFGLSNLKRVNLLVGKNNCGKTSILEAINFLVSKGNPFVLTGSAHRRGESGLLDVAETSGPYARDVLPDISHVFFGRHMDPGATLQISSDESFGLLLVELLSLPDIEDELSDRDRRNLQQVRSSKTKQIPNRHLDFEFPVTYPTGFLSFPFLRMDCCRCRVPVDFEGYFLGRCLVGLLSHSSRRIRFSPVQCGSCGIKCLPRAGNPRSSTR